MDLGGTGNIGEIDLMRDGFFGFSVLAGGIDAQYVTVPSHTFNVTSMLVFEQLIEDVEDALGQPDTEYFLGNLIVTNRRGSVTNYEVIDGQYVDMFEAGIIDPAKVTRSAIENAASIASMILTTEALVTDIPEEKPPMPAGGPPGGMGGMY